MSQELRPVSQSYGGKLCAIPRSHVGTRLLYFWNNANPFVLDLPIISYSYKTLSYQLWLLKLAKMKYVCIDHGAIRTHKSLVPKTNALTIRPRGQTFNYQPISNSIKTIKEALIVIHKVPWRRLHFS